MEIVLKMLRMPLVKIIGVCVVLYFGLLHDKQDPQSLGNRLSPDRVKKNISEVQEKSNFILQNISMIRQGVQESAAANINNEQDLSDITTKDVIVGKGDQWAKCGDEVEISYDVHEKNSSEFLESIKNEKLIIGSGMNILLEQQIMGMKRGGVRSINIPRHFKLIHQKLILLPKLSEIDADLVYDVTLLNFSAINNQNLDCSSQ